MLMLGVEQSAKFKSKQQLAPSPIDTGMHLSVARTQLLDQLDLASTSVNIRSILTNLITDDLVSSVLTTYGGILQFLEDCFIYSEHSERIATIIASLKHTEQQLQSRADRFESNVRNQHFRSSQEQAVRQHVLGFLLLLQLVDQYASYIRPGTAASSQAHTQLLAEIRRLQTHFLSLVSSI